MIPEEYSSTRIISVFHLKKRRSPADIQDPLYRYFRWLIAYYKTSGDELEKYIISRLTWQTLRKLFMNQNLLVIIPLDHNALEPLKNYSRTLNYKGVVLEKPVKVKGKTYKALIPVLMFKDLVSAWKHMLFTVVLATLKKPRENANIVAKAIDNIRSEKILEAFYTMITERFNEIREELIAKPGSWYRRIGWVTRVGYAFRVLHDINIE